MTGTLYGIGVGPGDPELMTLKAARLVAGCPVVAYPQLGDTPSFARSIASAYIPDGRDEIVVKVPLGDPGGTEAAYDAGAKSIAAALSAGKDVAALCEGDPLLYGSFIYLWQRLRDRFDCETIPGVSSILAGPARIGAALAAGSERVCIVPGTLDDDALEAAIGATEAVAILKVGRHLPRLKRLIERRGLLPDAHYIERATLPNEKVLPLADVPPESAPYFSIILIARAGAAR